MKLLSIEKLFSTVYSNRLRNEIIAVLFILTAVFLSSNALFKPGFFRTIDDVTTVRLQYLHAELETVSWNTFPVRWSSGLAHGYGYPLFVFYAPFPYYIGAAAMQFLSLSGIVATKFIYVLPLLFGPILFYLVARTRLSVLYATGATILFSFFPYRGYNAYTRGGVGESWAIAFVPVIFFGVFLLEKKNRWGISVLASGIALTLISHNLVGFQALVLLLGYGLLFLRKNLQFWYSVLLGIGLSAFYLLPMLLHLTDVRVLTTEPNSGLILIRLAPIAYAFNIPYPITFDDKYSGIFSYVLLLGIAAFFFKYKQQAFTKNPRLVFWTLVSSFFVLLITELSYALWLISRPVTQILQFPWRVLSLLSFSIPFTIGLLAQTISRKVTNYLFVGFVAISVVYFYPMFRPEEYSFFYEYYAEGSGPCATTTWEDEYLPKNVLDCATGPNDFLSNTSGTLETTEHTPSNLSATITTEEETTIAVNKYYFPGWRVLVNESEVVPDMSSNPNGTFTFTVPEGRSSIAISYTKTMPMLLADLVSLTSVGVLMILVFYNVTHSTKLKKLILEK